MPLLPSFGRPYYTIRLDGDDQAGLTRLLDALGPAEAKSPVTTIRQPSPRSSTSRPDSPPPHFARPARGLPGSYPASGHTRLTPLPVQLAGITRAPDRRSTRRPGRPHVGIHPRFPVPLLNNLLAPLRAVPAGDPEREAVALSLAAPGRPGGENDLPNGSQYDDNSHPQSRMRAVREASDLALHLWAILGSNQ